MILLSYPVNSTLKTALIKLVETMRPFLIVYRTVFFSVETVIAVFSSFLYIFLTDYILGKTGKNTMLQH